MSTGRNRVVRRSDEGGFEVGNFCQRRSCDGGISVTALDLHNLPDLAISHIGDCDQG